MYEMAQDKVGAIYLFLALVLYEFNIIVCHEREVERDKRQIF